MGEMDTLRREVVRRLRGRIIFFGQLIVWLLGVLSFLATPYNGSTHWIKVNLGFYIALHGAFLFWYSLRHFRWWSKIVDRALQRELTHQNHLQPKSKRGVYLSDDGELETFDDEAPIKRKAGEKS